MGNAERLIGKFYVYDAELQQAVLGIAGKFDAVEPPEFLIVQIVERKWALLLPITTSTEVGSQDVRVPIRGMPRHSRGPITVHCGFAVKCPIEVLRKWGELDIELNAFYAFQIAQQVHGVNLHSSVRAKEIDADEDYREQVRFMTEVMDMLWERYKNA